MTDPFFERLSAMDAMFLEIEDESVHMHIGGIGIFPAAPLRRPEGGLDLDLILRFAEARLHKSPRLRQKLATTPWFDRPVWVDDDRFNLSYHVRHTALPAPGTERQLKRMAGRILSQQLDRARPLWETWIIEGLEGDRLAVLSKLHHCIADGVSSSDLAGLLVGAKPRTEPGTAQPWHPRPAPDGARLFASEAWRRASAPLELVFPPTGGTTGNARGADGSLLGRRLPSLGDALGTLGRLTRGAARAAESSLFPASETPLNVPIGPHRRFDWIRLDLPTVKRVGLAAGGKLNDAVLAIVTGALRPFFYERDLDLSDLTFRVAVPVNVRTEADAGRLGNRVSSLVVELPIEERDPWGRLERIVATTSDLKSSGQSQAIDLFGRMADWLPAGAMAGITRAGNRAVNMIVTNMPGPRDTTYMIDAPLLESVPFAPLMANQALSLAIYSYRDGLTLGFLADWDAVPDLHLLVEAVPTELEALTKAAEANGY